jgi:hypothetical protein
MPGEPIRVDAGVFCRIMVDDKGYAHTQTWDHGTKVWTDGGPHPADVMDFPIASDQSLEKAGLSNRP